MSNDLERIDDLCDPTDLQYSTQTVEGNKVRLTTDSLYLQKDPTEIISIGLARIDSIRCREIQDERKDWFWLLFGGTAISCVSYLYSLFPASESFAYIGIGMGFIIALSGLLMYFKQDKETVYLEFHTPSNTYRLTVLADNSFDILETVSKQSFQQIPSENEQERIE